MTRKVAFSNGTQGYGWMANWCNRCQRDAIFRNMGKGTGCPIIASVLVNNTVPPEWFCATEEDEIYANYTCIEFRGPGGGDPEPRPKPEPPQDGLFERPERGVRMLLPLADQAPTKPPLDRCSGKGVRVCACESRPAAGADLTSSLTIRPPERRAAGRVAHARTGSTGTAREAVQA